MLPRVNSIHTDIGEFLLFSTNDYISRHLYSNGTWDSHILIVSKLIYEDIKAPVILDIGANLGAYSVPIGRDVLATGGQVHSFEPQRIVYYQLCGNLLLNRLDNVFSYNVALGESDGQIEIPVLDYHNSDNIGAFSLDDQLHKLSKLTPRISGEKQSVQIIRLDSINLPISPCLIKIDVEGMELNVLKGGGEFLRTHNYPPILLEIWGYDWYANQKNELVSFLESLGYQLTLIHAHDYIAQHPSHSSPYLIQKDGSGKIIKNIKV
jgi:FkbM family methyltransferase